MGDAGPEPTPAEVLPRLGKGVGRGDKDDDDDEESLDEEGTAVTVLSGGNRGMFCGGAADRG